VRAFAYAGSRIEIVSFSAPAKSPAASRHTSVREHELPAQDAERRVETMTVGLRTWTLFPFVRDEAAAVRARG
jgi:hypothetical protein